MTSAHHFIDISQNILNLWMRLIFPEPRHPGLQFEYKNETILIRIELDILFEVGSTGCYSNYEKTEFWLASYSHQSFHLMHQIFPKAKMRSRFMIFCQPSLNGIPFIFFLNHYYINPPPPSFQSTKKTPYLLLSWVLVKLSNLVISWSS